MVDFYKLMAKFYDLIDIIYFTKNGINPRKEILDIIPDQKVRVLDLCCGTMGNSLRIAATKKQCQVYGVDLSAQMLRIAKSKVRKDHLDNVHLKKQDATNTHFKDHSFDYIIIGLVLHEMDEQLATKLLNEASRLLKQDGKLIVLEWERSEKLLKRLLFFPVKKLEPKPFRKFFSMDKERYFNQHGFETVDQKHCDYSCVYILRTK